MFEAAPRSVNLYAKRAANQHLSVLLKFKWSCLILLSSYLTGNNEQAGRVGGVQQSSLGSGLSLASRLSVASLDSHVAFPVTRQTPVCSWIYE